MEACHGGQTARTVGARRPGTHNCRERAQRGSGAAHRGKPSLTAGRISLILLMFICHYQPMSQEHDVPVCREDLTFPAKMPLHKATYL